MPVYALEEFVPELAGEGRCWIAPTALVIGRVRLKQDANVWFGSVLRGDNEWIEVGERSNIQESCTLHTDMGFPLTIGPDCTIGHNVILHGCEIGANSLIGMGATILNGAKIGRNSLVGANALVTEGKQFPDGVLIVGAPARAARQLDIAAIEQIKSAATHYVDNARRHARGLRELHTGR